MYSTLINVFGESIHIFLITVIIWTIIHFRLEVEFQDSLYIPKNYWFGLYKAKQIFWVLMNEFAKIRDVIHCRNSRRTLHFVLFDLLFSDKNLVEPSRKLIKMINLKEKELKMWNLTNIFTENGDIKIPFSNIIWMLQDRNAPCSYCTNFFSLLILHYTSQKKLLF